MSQNGPYPGRPSQPWSAGGADEPYREPADPWGDRHGEVPHDGTWGAAPVSMPPGGSGESTAHTGYPGGATPSPPYAGMWGDDFTAEPDPQYRPDPASAPPPVWAPMPAAPPPGRRGQQRAIVALAIAFAVLACAGLGTTAWVMLRESGRAAEAADDPRWTPSTVRPTTPAAPATPGDANAAPPNSTDARFVTKGQCVRNEGTADVPEMSISPCASGAYEVLFRVNGRTTGEADAEAKCAKVPNYSKWYFYDSDLDSLDFVLCLKER